MSEYGKSLTPDEQLEINNSLNDAEKHLESENLDDIKRAIADVEKQTEIITEALMAAV